NEAGVPAGPTITKVKVGFKLKITGSNYTSTVTVFIDGIGFVKPSLIRSDGLLIQKGTLTNGMGILDYVTSGRTIVLSVQNSDGGLGTLTYTRP
ncbi:MAG TPA: hypothetical protein VEZ90_00575, partial [Blastocatellia bacterium]|nr:hypothetical protein [Blastocatellia bacterium]